MARRSLLVAAATLLLGLAIPVFPAAAGGGCHSGATTGTGDTVEMVNACFTPSTLRLEPGGEVAFVNRDPLIHNVTANGWGNFEDMNEGDAFTATFEEAGVYPYACAYHPGMSGAIVVGDGAGPGNGAVITVESFTEPLPRAELQAEVTQPAAASGSTAFGWIGGGAIGLALGIGTAALVARRRTHRASASPTS